MNVRKVSWHGMNSLHSMREAVFDTRNSRTVIFKASAVV